MTPYFPAYVRPYDFGIQAALARISRPVSADDVAHMLAEQNRQSAKEPKK